MAGYTQTYADWQRDPTGFWAQAAADIDWIKPPEVVLDTQNHPLATWFPDAICNTCYNAVDRHVEAGRGGQTAIIHDSPVTNSTTKITYDTLLDRVARVAGVLVSHGVAKGDRVIIYMPMIPEALIAMLACARIGAVYSVVFGGFSAHELAVRIDDATPKAIVGASAGIEGSRTIPYKPLIDGAINRADHKPDFTLILQRPQSEAELVGGFDFDWLTEEEGATPAACVPVGGADPLYILYTSGTTGQPKGVVRHNGGHMVALHWTMKNIYNVTAGDVFWAASDVGWVVGHSYICYGPLLAGCTTVVFEGKPIGTPDAGTFWRVIEDHDVKVLFTAPTALRAIKREDPDAKAVLDYDLSGLQSLFLAGERADPDTIKWAQKHLKKTVVDHWWQTETGWAIAANPLGIEELAIKLGSPAVPMPGYEIDILDEGGNPVAAGELGAITIKLPLPPGALPTLWNAEGRFRSAYLQTFLGYFETGDAGIKDADGYLYIMARTDDVINVAGHRLSTGAMEEILSNHPDVADYDASAAGIAQVEADIGPIDVVVANAGITRDAPFHKMTPEQWHEVIDTNLTGVFNTVHPIWPGMRERKFGRVIVISSVNGQKGQFAQVNYAATKAGDLGIVKSLAQEGARAGITANAVCPGYIATEMVMAVPEKVRESIIAQIPAGRLGEPEEIARCVAFLASDNAGFINGSTISANGAQFFA